MTTVMSAEIAEQPAAVARTLEALLPRRPEIRALAESCRTVLFAARGSSDNAAIYGRYLLETHAGRLAGLASPSVATHYGAELDLRDVLVVGISQSGETAEIVTTLEWARASGARTVAVTNGADSALARTADLLLATEAGQERALPATKTYTTQLAAVAALGTALAPDPEALDTELARVPEEMQRCLGAGAAIDEAVTALASAEHLLVSARGLLLGTGLEVALKIEETSLRPVRALSYADLRHGPIAMISESLAGILVAPSSGPMVTGLRGLAEELRARGIRATVGLGGGADLAAVCDVAIPGPGLTEAVAPLAAIVPGQLLAERLALRLGLNPDLSRGLTKVTQTDPAGR